MFNFWHKELDNPDKHYSDVRVLLTGGAAPGFPSIAESLRPHWILATDFKESLAGRKIADEYRVTPNLVPFTEEAKYEYWYRMLDLTEDYDIDVVVPIRTYDAIAICDATISVPTLAPSRDPNIVNILANKFLLLSEAKAMGLDIPWFRKTTEFNIVPLWEGKVPFVIKPLVQSGSRGMRIVWSKYDIVNDILSKKPSECININFEQFEEIAAITDMLVMEYLPGIEYTVDCLCYDGGLLAMVPRRRDRMIGGITAAGEVVKDENFDEMYRVCESIVKKFRLSFAVGFQFKCNRDGKPRLIECNPRLQGSTCLTVAAGLDIPKLAVDLALGRFDQVKIPDFTYYMKWGTKFERTFREWYS